MQCKNYLYFYVLDIYVNTHLYTLYSHRSSPTFLTSIRHFMYFLQFIYFPSLASDLQIHLLLLCIYEISSCDYWEGHLLFFFFCNSSIYSPQSDTSTVTQNSRCSTVPSVTIPKTTEMSLLQFITSSYEILDYQNNVEPNNSKITLNKMRQYCTNTKQKDSKAQTQAFTLCNKNGMK